MLRSQLCQPNGLQLSEKFKMWMKARQATYAIPEMHQDTPDIIPEDVAYLQLRVSNRVLFFVKRRFLKLELHCLASSPPRVPESPESTKIIPDSCWAFC